MKTLVILYSPSATKYADEKLFAQKSAFERGIEWAKTVPNSISTEIILQTDLTDDDSANVFSLLKRIDELTQKHTADFVIYAWADCPFLDTNLTTELIDYHTRYKAEYTFTEGYPYGFAPEIIDSGTIRILYNLKNTKPTLHTSPINRDSLFTLIKTDINSFEIETLIAPNDWRYLRLQFCCDTKRNTLACKRLFDLAHKDTLKGNAFPSPTHGCGLPLLDNAKTLSTLAEKSAHIQRTLPAYYAIQIFSHNESQSLYEPAVNAATMDLSHFQKLLADIATFSEDAVISLSFLGDPLYHTDFIHFAKTVLAYKNLSLLIETDGHCVTTKIVDAITALVKDNPIRPNGQRAINWIIHLDATTEDIYKKIHNTKDTLAHAKQAVNILKNAFPHAVYPQMVRMKCNEKELESFFRHWKAEGTGELIIQKYDHISGLLPDERPADLSPAKRYACWHLKRDMYIRADGTAMRCRAAVFAKKNSDAIFGNVFKEPLCDVWAKGEKNLKEQLEYNYNGQCGASDEYYTFNF